MILELQVDVVESRSGNFIFLISAFTLTPFTVYQNECLFK